MTKAKTEKPEVRNTFTTQRQRTISGTTTKTQQHFKELCDINKIIKRHEKGEIVLHLNPGKPLYGDFTNADDYLGAMTRVQDAQAEFMALPSELRALCDNDPAKLLELVRDPETALVLAEMGAGKLVEYLHGPIEPIPNPETPAPAEGTETPKTGGKSPTDQ